jgi:hypothetical protein
MWMRKLQASWQSLIQVRGLFTEKYPPPPPDNISVKKLKGKKGEGEEGRVRTVGLPSEDILNSVYSSF